MTPQFGIGSSLFFHPSCITCRCVGRFSSTKVYLDYLKWEIDTESAFLELPLTILVLVSFAMLAMNILHQEQLYTIETAIERDIIENANFAWSGNFGHKGIEQVPVLKKMVLGQSNIVKSVSFSSRLGVKIWRERTSEYPTMCCSVLIHLVSGLFHCRLLVVAALGLHGFNCEAQLAVQ